jgi:hypothetical protein
MSDEKVGRMIFSVMIIGPAHVKLQEVAHSKRFAK